MLKCLSNFVPLARLPFLLMGNISRCSSIAETLVSKNRDYPLLV